MYIHTSISSEWGHEYFFRVQMGCSQQLLSSLTTHRYSLLLSFRLKTQITEMMRLLGVPNNIRTDCGYLVSGREAFCLLLYRLSFPHRLTHMRVLFGMAESCICEAFNYMLHFLDVTWGDLLKLDMDRLVPLLGDFAEALHSWGCPLDNCWGFIDGTVRGIARQVTNKT